MRVTAGGCWEHKLAQVIFSPPVNLIAHSHPVFIPVFIVGHSWLMFSKWGIHDVVFSLFSTEAIEGSNSNGRERTLQHFRNHGREKGQEKDNEAFKISPAKLQSYWIKCSLGT